MTWSPRQLAMLQAMGLRQWAPSPAQHLAPQAEPASPHAAARSGGTAAVAVPVRPELAAPAPASSIVATQAQAQVGALDWTALREAVADCRACGLCQGRRQTVFGVGHKQAHWMVIGEAPGEQEDLAGEPFVGAAGQLLDRMLQALNLSRSDDSGRAPEQCVYIANTLKCRPPRNRNPEPDEMAKCEPFLLRQIELVRPRMILAMGRFAVQALLRSDQPLGKLRGRVHRYQGVPLVVTYHPAYLLRNLPEKAKAWDDLCLAADHLERLSRGQDAT